MIVVCVIFTHTTFASHILGGVIQVAQTSQDSTSIGMVVLRYVDGSFRKMFIQN